MERHLRRYEREARIEHWCDRCCEWILPGDMYEGIVVLYQDQKHHRLQVLKYHVFPDCDFPPEPEDYAEVDHEEDVQEFARAA